jgi:hypothetical protein
MVGSNKIMTTIVTAYYKLPKAKAPHEQYVEWMKNMLAIDNEMIIFCDSKSVDEMRELRSGKLTKTRIIGIDFREFYTYRYVNDFLQHSKMDPEVAIGHNVFLYMIWSEKSHFLKRAIELDPFKTEYFLWTDIGCFRRPNRDFLRWPNTARIPKDRVLLLSVVPFTENELLAYSRETLPSFQFMNRIGGTIFGGGKDVLLKWHNKYYDMLEYFISTKRFIGKDQSIMNSVYLLNRDMCELVNWKRGCSDEWFYLQDYLRIL